MGSNPIDSTDHLRPFSFLEKAPALQAGIDEFDPRRGYCSFGFKALMVMHSALNRVNSDRYRVDPPPQPLDGRHFGLMT